MFQNQFLNILNNILPVVNSEIATDNRLSIATSYFKTNDIVNFEQNGPGYGVARKLSYRILSNYHTYPYKCTVK